jgi:hypothetical protein
MGVGGRGRGGCRIAPALGGIFRIGRPAIDLKSDGGETQHDEHAHHHDGDFDAFHKAGIGDGIFGGTILGFGADGAGVGGHDGGGLPDFKRANKHRRGGACQGNPCRKRSTNLRADFRTGLQRPRLRDADTARRVAP